MAMASTAESSFSATPENTSDHANASQASAITESSVSDSARSATQAYTLEQLKNGVEVSPANQRLMETQATRQESKQEVSAAAKPETKAVTYTETDVAELRKLQLAIDLKKNGRVYEPSWMERAMAKVYMVTHPGLKLKEIIFGGNLPAYSKTSSEESYKKHKQILQCNKYWELHERIFPGKLAAMKKHDEAMALAAKQAEADEDKD